MAIIWCETMEKITKRPIEFIRDSKFENGFAIHGATHEEGLTAQYAGTSQSTEPQAWNIAQWANYKYPLTKDTSRINLDNGGYIYETPTCRLDVHTCDDYLLRLELRASEEYEGHVRKAGEAWPHLLIEQHDCVDFFPGLGELNKLNYSISLMIEYCKSHMTPEEFDPELHCSQVSHYLALGDMEAYDWFWFGITFWDNRYEVCPGHISEDVGKDDASHKMIVVEPLTNYTDVIPKYGQWIDIKVDLLPHIRKAVEMAQGRGYLKNVKMERLKVLSTNLGFENPGNFDSAMQIRELSLIGE